MALREVENSLFLGVAKRLSEKPEAVFMIALQADGTVEAAALWTPPFPLSICAADEERAEQLADAVLDAAGPPVPGVIGLWDHATRFAERWAARPGQAFRPELEMTFYTLDRVVPPPVPAPGILRPAAARDRDWLIDWHVAFAEGAALPVAERSRDHVADLVRRKLAESLLYVWEDRGRPVSVLGYTPTGISGVRIGPVMTAPAERGRGYAGTAVATLTQRLLDAGARWCGVFADVANPQSNRLYQRLGFREVCRFRSLAFLR